MIPARRNRETNAYAALMTEELERVGCVVDDISAIRSFMPLYDIVHVHWPHVYAHERSYPVALLRSMAFVLFLWLQRIFGARIVWTVHDVEAMTSSRRRLKALLMDSIVPIMSGFVFLSRSSMELAVARYPVMRRRPRCITRHALYGGTYADVNRAAARATFGLDPEARIVGFLGDIKPYKGLDGLLDACERIGPDGPVVLVAGAAVTPSNAEYIAARVSALQARGVPIVRIDKRLSDEEMAAAIAACDVVVAPYQVSWNSGIATLVLEHDRPLLCPNFPIFRELQEEVGERWIELYAPPLTAHHIVRAVEQARLDEAGDPKVPPAFRETRSWPAIAREIVDFYRTL